MTCCAFFSPLLYFSLYSSLHYTLLFSSLRFPSLLYSARTFVHRKVYSNWTPFDKWSFEPLRTTLIQPGFFRHILVSDFGTSLKPPTKVFDDRSWGRFTCFSQGGRISEFPRGAGALINSLEGPKSKKDLMICVKVAFTRSQMLTMHGPQDIGRFTKEQ